MPLVSNEWLSVRRELLKGYYSVQELAEQLGVTTRSIRNYLREGKLKGTKVGGKWKFSEQNLFDFLYGGKENAVIKEEKQLAFDAPVILKFSFVVNDFHKMNELKEKILNYHLDVYANKKDRLLQYIHFKENEYEILIGGNFNYVTNFGTWINNLLQNQTAVSFKD
ncbi:excisionase family DNA binding domain-containing protein [Enterococcus ratti]|uniref:Excisionase family DNA binding domain-containing protein n=1 Tax=Enterococcus ratti TaxID=150033 RepID=A0A1L8WIK7_9ENTE|nr:excisionase family DNA binding domain-containing protein [Enterococcus ratti]